MALAALSILLVWSSACRALVPRHYEYDEQIDLSLDGSASLFINGSVPAIIALRGIPLDLAFRRRRARGRAQVL
jgi:hypothetical protein